jgi:hypothetical protein
VKTAGYLTIAVFLLAASGAQAQVQPEKRRSVYLKIKGPEDSAAKLRAVFAEAASKTDLFLADDPRRAGSQVSVTLEERKLEKPLYAEVVAATLFSREGKSFPVYACRKVTDGGGYSTITTKSGKAHMPKDEPAKKLVWIEKKSAPVDLVEAVTRELVNADFQVVAEENLAEFTLKDIRLLKEPLRANAVEAKVQSVISPGKSSSLTINSNIKSYISVIEPISAEAEGCRDSLRHVMEQSSMPYQSVAAVDLALIARNIK